MALTDVVGITVVFAITPDTTSVDMVLLWPDAISYCFNCSSHIEGNVEARYIRKHGHHLRMIAAIEFYCFLFSLLPFTTKPHLKKSF